jgi:hypothetical protein
VELIFMKNLLLTIILAIIFIPANLFAKDNTPLIDPQNGDVTIPRVEYDRIALERFAREYQPNSKPLYTLGDVNISANIKGLEHQTSGEITTEIDLDVLSEEWITIPLFSSQSKIIKAQADGKRIALQQGAEGLLWSTSEKGPHHLKITASLLQPSSEAGLPSSTIIINPPQGVAIRFNGEIEGTDLGLTITPSIFSEITEQDGKTKIKAELPSTTSFALNWSKKITDQSISARGVFRGEESEQLVSPLVFWKGEITLETAQTNKFMFPLLPISTPISSVSIDGKESGIVQNESWYLVPIKGAGTHRIEVGFSTPILGGTTPKLSLTPPKLSIARFELNLHGQKEVKVSSGATIESRIEKTQTKVTANFPATIPVEFSWVEAVPLEKDNLGNLNLALYHSYQAHDGLLITDVLAQIEINKGKRSSIDFTIPEGIQVNKVVSGDGVIADWRVVNENSRNLLRVFFNQPLNTANITINFDQPISQATPQTEFNLPLLSPINAGRLHGALALVASNDFTFNTVTESSLVSVGESNIPTELREGIKGQIVHTYKYAGENPALRVQLTPPQKAQGRFDAIIDSLFSISDLSLKALSTIELIVKAGKVSDLEFTLPAKVSLLNLTAPSLRSYDMAPSGNEQKVTVHFTQELEGAIDIQLQYELIIEEKDRANLIVPTLSVIGAEVEQGRYAVEAINALEIKPEHSDGLSILDSSEIPKRLLLSTNNPILFGYKYFKTDAPHSLTLKIVKHHEIAPQLALIEHASYRTLYTKDGVVLTGADLLIRNTGKQFLKLTLPVGSEVWSATVNGKTTKPAEEILTTETTGTNVLIQLISSTEPFHVTIIYKDKSPELSWFGSISTHLPTPDLVESNTEWEVFVPNRFGYWSSQSSLDEESFSTKLSNDLLQTIPTEGTRFAMKRLYSTESENVSSLSLFYISKGLLFGMVFCMISFLGIYIWLRKTIKN